jgi:hypothetical protein
MLNACQKNFEHDTRMHSYNVILTVCFSSVNKTVKKELHVIPIHYLTYWRSASPTTNSEIWMTTGNKYLSVRKFLGMCINHKRGHYTSGEGRNKTNTQMHIQYYEFQTVPCKN